MLVAANCKNEMQGKRLTLVVAFKPGGGYDLYARSLRPLLSQLTGVSVTVANLSSAGGMQAVRAVLSSRPGHLWVGLLNLHQFLQPHLEAGQTVPMSNFHYLGALGLERAIWLAPAGLSWPPSPGQTLASSAGDAFSRLVLPAQLMDLKVRQVSGYEGSTERWLAMLRKEIDFVPVTQATAQRLLEGDPQAKPLILLDKQARPAFKGVSYLAGSGGWVDLATRGGDAGAREKALERAALAVELASSVRALVTSSQLPSATRACLESVIARALVDPALARDLKRQRLEFEPMTHAQLHDHMNALQALIERHRSWLSGSGAAAASVRAP